MMLWNLVLFVHICGAALWVGGQLVLTLIVVPLARRALPEQTRAEVVSAVGRRFALVTVAAFLPVQIATGIALAAHAGATFASLTEPGFGRTLLAKLALVVAAMVAAATHGILAARGRPVAARAASACALLCSLGVVLLAVDLASL
jgi:uncharacterized membrane protein